jgi:nitroimidazol reductase NimA-like FMN-containing flavoprotein (pyridoxamine 5'-phosphate oxidase superfamily)
MRKSEREITSRAEIDAIIRGSEVCRLAFAVSDEPYIVPVSFGYDGHSLYFHTADTGRKIDCIAANNRACFEMERNVRLVKDPLKPCKWSFSYESVIGFGEVCELQSPAEKARGLNHIMEHYSGREWDFDSFAMKGTRVWRISISSVTGKRAEHKDPS